MNDVCRPKLEQDRHFPASELEQVHLSSQLAGSEPVTSQPRARRESVAGLGRGAHVTFSGLPVMQLTAWLAHIPRQSCVYVIGKAAGSAPSQVAVSSQLPAGTEPVPAYGLGAHVMFFWIPDAQPTAWFRQLSSCEREEGVQPPV